jgi:hypothetical protein
MIFTSKVSSISFPPIHQHINDFSYHHGSQLAGISSLTCHVRFPIVWDPASGVVGLVFAITQALEYQPSHSLKVPLQHVASSDTNIAIGFYATPGYERQSISHDKTSRFEKRMKSVEGATQTPRPVVRHSGIEPMWRMQQGNGFGLYQPTDHRSSLMRDASRHISSNPCGGLVAHML